MTHKEESSQSGRQAAVSLSDEGQVRDVLADSILGLWDVVNNLTRLKPTRRERFRVTLFGSARIAPGTFSYEETKRCAAELTKLGCDIITGGGPGLMQAANEGAATDPDRSHSIGIRVDLPFEQEVNSFVGQAFEHRTFFTRLQQFVLQSDAFIVAPGGIGTALETLMAWQLLQVQHLVGTPLILVGEMWPGLVEWARASMISADPPLASEEDMNIPQCVKNADVAIAIIREYHSRWADEFGSGSNSEAGNYESSAGTEM
ncbi:putative lysine decarboxylase [Thalassoglobus neptunius]|uniref:AMP nucleosidase n=2 Tax=Thalassoglobus neptunius TaxID=1938619 RepID=A0A5C5X7X7_9PLAN|nr:putative lysine decarboxylase [Thalassoglobus neptunius]